MADKSDANTTISDVAGLLVTVEFIKETVTEVNQRVKEQNGKLDNLAVEQARLDEWRKAHTWTHREMKEKRRRDDWLERVITGLAVGAAAIVGYFK